MELWWPWGLGFVPPILAGWLVWFLARHRPKRTALHVLSFLASTVSIGAALLLSLFLLTAHGCEEDRDLIGAPDGRHVARLMIYGNVPAGTSLRVIVRRSWSPVWHDVSGARSVGTPLEPIEPRIFWQDSSHLVLDYPEKTEGTGFDCKSRNVGGITLVCRTHQTSYRMPAAQ